MPQENHSIVYLVDYAATTIKLEPHAVNIKNARLYDVPPQLETSGFELVQFETSLQDVLDKAAVQTIFKPEAERLLAQKLAARQVIMFASLARDMRESANDENLGPATNVHVDHDQATYEYSMTQVMPPEEVEYWLTPQPSPHF